MTIKEYADKIIANLESSGCKNAKVLEYLPCQITQTSYSYELFSRKRIPETAEIKERPAVIDGRIPGVMVTVSFVKPRCRKETRDYFRAVLA